MSNRRSTKHYKYTWNLYVFAIIHGTMRNNFRFYVLGSSIVCCLFCRNTIMFDCLSVVFMYRIRNSIYEMYEALIIEIPSGYILAIASFCFSDSS